jgi:mannose-6-phosphate isomerase-like protein (cupin superfamily)
MGARPTNAWRTVHLDELPRIPLGGLWRPVRREFGVTGFGINGYSADSVGAELIEPHDETSPGSGRHEELYLVVEGTARFRVEETAFDAPTGTFVFVPPGVQREATAAEAPATVVVVGGRPGDALPVSPFEYWYAAEPAYQAGDYAEAVRIASEGLADYPEHALLNYQLACYKALAGSAEAALAHLEIACRDERVRGWVADDEDFASLRGDERFVRLVGGEP